MHLPVLQVRVPCINRSSDRTPVCLCRMNKPKKSTRRKSSPTQTSPYPCCMPSVRSACMLRRASIKELLGSGRLGCPPAPESLGPDWGVLAMARAQSMVVQITQLSLELTHKGRSTLTSPGPGTTALKHACAYPAITALMHAGYTRE